MNDDWIKNFIEYDPEWELYIAYDETQAYEIGSYETWDEAALAIKEYAKTL